MKGTCVTSHFKGQLYSWGEFKKKRGGGGKRKEKKISLFKKYAFSVDLASVLPVLDIKGWLLLIWPNGVITPV